MWVVRAWHTTEALHIAARWPSAPRFDHIARLKGRTVGEHACVICFIAGEAMTSGGTNIRFGPVDAGLADDQACATGRSAVSGPSALETLLVQTTMHVYAGSGLIHH